MRKKLVLIDGHSILNRAFYGLPDLTNARGEHTNAVYGFLNIMFKIIDEENPDYLTVAFDVKKPTFRHEIFQEYKGTRKPMPEELREQVPLIKEVLQAMEITIIEKPGYEADDILGTIARMAEKKGVDVSLVSGDRDLLQIASENIKVRIPKTKRGGTEIEDYYAKDVIEKYQVTPLQIIDLKGLMGDTADNIPGVPGIGEKTATKIIKEFETVENAILHVDEISPKKAKENLRQFEEQARLSKVLATIKTDCILEYVMEDASLEHMFNENSFSLMKRLEFKTILSKFNHEISTKKQITKSIYRLKFKNDVEKFFEEITSISIIEKESRVGFQLFAKKDIVTPGPKKEEQQFMEEDGQFSMFTVMEPKDKKGDKLEFVTFSINDKVYYLECNEDITEKWIAEKLYTLLENKVKFCTINLKNQLYILDYLFEKNGINKEVASYDSDKIFFDCSIAAYLLNPISEAYDYDDLARDYLDIAFSSWKDFFGKESMQQKKETDEKTYVDFLVNYAFVSQKIWQELEKKLTEQNMNTLFWDVEMPLVFVLYEMEQQGIRVNKKELSEYSEKLGVRISKLEKEIYELAGEEFNINSPKQLGIILFEKLEMPFAKKTKTGYSTSADILEKLKGKFPIVDCILEYRQLAKLKSTYADGLVNYINEVDGRIHGRFNQTITATGRLSSTEPNLQNIPIRMEIGREIRKVFIPRDGYVFLDADYSQIELRILAHVSKDESLINAYNDGIDIHRMTASEVFHTPFDEVSSKQRSDAKAVNFGIVYGISSFGLGQDLHISKKEAEEYIQKYFATYPGIKTFLDQAVVQGKKNGYVASLMGRIRPIPEILSANFMQRSFGERIAMNSPIQGTAADIIKIAMVRVSRALKEQNLKSKLLLQVHDELLIETHPDEIDVVKSLLEKEMSSAMQLSVPLEVEVLEGNNWNEAH